MLSNGKLFSVLIAVMHWKTVRSMGIPRLALKPTRRLGLTYPSLEHCYSILDMGNSNLICVIQLYIFSLLLKVCSVTVNLVSSAVGHSLWPSIRLAQSHSCWRHYHPYRKIIKTFNALPNQYIPQVGVITRAFL